MGGGDDNNDPTTVVATVMEVRVVSKFQPVDFSLRDASQVENRGSFGRLVVILFCFHSTLNTHNCSQHSILFHDGGIALYVILISPGKNVDRTDFTYSSSSEDYEDDGERTPLTGNTYVKLNDTNDDTGERNPRRQPRKQQRGIVSSMLLMNGGNGGGGNTKTSMATYQDEIDDLRKKDQIAGTSGSCMDSLKCALAISASAIAILLCCRVLWTAYMWNNKSNHHNNNGRNNPIFGTLYPGTDDDAYDAAASGTGYSSPFSSAISHDDLGRFILEDYDARPPFSDFLPGLAGIYGIPMYAFFVNRGQGITSFGVRSKDYPILEFNSANKAYQNTALLGFRTFIKGKRSKASGSFFMEPFNPMTTRYVLDDDGSLNYNDGDAYWGVPTGSTLVDRGPRRRHLPKRTMYTGANEMQIQEIDTVHQLETNVTYFILPEEDFGAFVRRTTITNTHKEEKITLSVLDGLPKIEPYGGQLDKLLKNMGRTLEGWMGVYFPYDDSITMPFYRLSSEPKDTASVQVLEAGHYCLSFVEGDPKKGTESRFLPFVYDSNMVFGEDTTLLRPLAFMSKPLHDIVAGPQYGLAKTSSAFAAGMHRSLPR